MHDQPDDTDVLLTAIILFAVIVIWFGKPALRSFLSWYERRAVRIASERADEMWRAAELEDPPPPPRRGVRLMGKERVG